MDAAPGAAEGESMKAYLEIEMPKNCNGCPLQFYEGQGICSCCGLPTIEDDEILKPWKNKRKDCPLVPIQPHGDLIDRDALKAAICSRLCIESEKYLSPEEATIVNEIFAAPTIIPAEEGET